MTLSEQVSKYSLPNVMKLSTMIKFLKMSFVDHLHALMKSDASNRNQNIKAHKRTIFFLHVYFCSLFHNQFSTLRVDHSVK